MSLASPLRTVCALLLILLATGCAGPRIDLATWRVVQAGPRAVDGSASASVDDQLAEVEALRSAMELEKSRVLALRLAADHPADARALVAASRAESDGVFLFPEDDKSSRNHAAASASVDDQLAEVEALRAAMELEKSRVLALHLAADHPADARALVAASRAESDGVFLFPEDDKSSRNHAAASALDFALRARKAGASSAAAHAQLAWALGTSTHLQPMFDRAEHAKRTLDAARAALELDPNEPTALATVAMVHWRLETLPWIASVMAFDAPDSSLKEAERAAYAACQALPNRENRLILAKVELARGARAAARAVLDLALESQPSYPRDRVLEAPVRELRESLE